MNRRDFFRTAIFGLVAIPALSALARPAPKPLVLQHSPLAGFQYHMGRKTWSKLTDGAMLRLTREPDNPHDKRAVAVYANRHKLGYLPRVENAAPAYLLDSGHRLFARITRLRESRNPWERVRMEVLLESDMHCDE